MTTVRATESAEIAAPAEAIYATIADYAEGHPHILPTDYFGPLEVEKGGVGAGTVARTTITFFGNTQPVHVEVTEPVPGRVLVETDLATGAATTFTVDPLDSHHSLVTITTEYAATGLRGLIEPLLTPLLLRRVYRAELEKIAAYHEQG